MNLNYEKDISIDEASLDIEWLQQPSLVIKYSRLMAAAELEMAQSKSNLDITKAKMDQRIRANPEKYKVEKVTETAIFNAIIVSEEYNQSLEAYNNTVYEYNMAKAAVRALEHKKEALENLVRLFGQQYFAGPTIPRNLSKEWQRKEEQKKADSKVAATLKRKQ